MCSWSPNVLCRATWPTEIQEALHLQEALRRQVRLEDDLKPLATVAGVDVAFPRREQGHVARCAVVVLSFPALQVREQATAEVPITFPYVPGLLAFREGPAILAALARLSLQPDLLMFDGQGVAHPRRLGIASHLGVLLDWPTIGCAKSRLFGHADEPGPHPGDRSPLLAPEGELIGYALRTQSHTQPVYVSPGHRVCHETAVHLVMACLRKHRLPEPTRLADQLSKAPSAQPRQPRLLDEA